MNTREGIRRLGLIGKLGVLLGLTVGLLMSFVLGGVLGIPLGGRIVLLGGILWAASWIADGFMH